MARTSNQDPFDKFRFLVTILSNSTQERIVPSGGFTDVSSPKVTITENSYRENTHGNSFIKKPGLARYEPITLRKGSTVSDRDLYLWLREVYDHSGSLNMYQEALANFSIVPVQNSEFRRDVVISIVARDGSTPKHWYLSNAFPIEYSPGDLSSSADEKLISEISLAYEGFVEIDAANVNEAISKVSAEADEAVQKANQQAVVGAATGLLGGLF